MKPKPLKERIREILVNLIAFHNSGVPVLKYDIDQAEENIKGLRLSEEEILKITEGELLHPDTLDDLKYQENKTEDLMKILSKLVAHALYEAQTKKEEG